MKRSLSVFPPEVRVVVPWTPGPECGKAAWHRFFDALQAKFSLGGLTKKAVSMMMPAGTHWKFYWGTQLTSGCAFKDCSVCF